MKKILYSLVLLLIFVPFVFAQQNQTTESIIGEEKSNALFVSGIDIFSNQISTGSAIEGTFDITNARDYVISGARYRVELVQIFEDTIEYDYGDGLSVETMTFDHPTHAVHHTAISNPISVSSGTTKIPFSYQIPEVVPEGRVAVLIQLYESGDLMGDSDFVEINLSGRRVPHVLVTANVEVDGEDLNPLEGPTVDSSDQVKLNVLITNNSPQTLNLRSEIKVFEGNSTNGRLVHTSNPTNISVSGGDTEISYPVYLNLDPGVYTGLLSYFDESNNLRAIPLEFRYIIDGIKPKIGNVAYNTTSLIDQNLFVSVSYLDTPLSFRKNNDGTYRDSRVRKYIEINGAFDENNPDEFFNNFQNISSNLYLENMTAVVRVKDSIRGNLLSSKNISFSNSTEQTVDMGRILGTDQVLVEIELYQDGELIDTYSEDVLVETYQYKNIFDKIWNQYQNIILAILGFILLIIIFALIKKSKINKNIAISCLMSIIIIGSSFFLTENVNAFLNLRPHNDLYRKHDDNFVTSVVVTSPKPPSAQIYEPGQNIRFTADFNFMYCTNSGFKVKARMSRPVLVGASHANMGAWSNIKGGRNVGTTYSPKHFRNSTSLNFPLSAPNQPGVYHFRYDIVATSGEWGDIDSGVVRFRVARDVCKNLPGVQERVPRGYVAARNANGQPICRLVPPVNASLNCSASKNRLNLNEVVTYTARTVSGANANFRWYKTSNVIPANLVKTQNNVNMSTYSASYSTPGIYHTTAVAVVGGRSEQCRIVVSVGDEFRDFDLEDVDEDTVTDDVDDSDLFYTDDDGNKYPLDPNAPAGRIIFNMQNTLTNNTCTSDWRAENVLKCALYRNNIKVKDLEFAGNENLTPGTYQIKCIQAQDGREISSETRTCRLNPDLREF
jgi:hypothetical protein